MEKIWIILASSLVGVGLITFTIFMSINKWDFKTLSTTKYVTNEYNITETFNDLTITTTTADINFVPSTDGKIKVVCFEPDYNSPSSATVENNTLSINLDENKNKKWYHNILNFNTAKITVYLPSGEYGNLTINQTTGDIFITQDFKFNNINIDLTTGDVKSFASANDTIKITTSTGDISVNSANCHNLETSTTTGKISITDAVVENDTKIYVTTGDATLNSVSCKNLTSTGGTGDLTLKKVIATEKFTIERTTGDTKFIECDASEIVVNTTTGDVTGTILTDKIFLTKTTTGDVNVPRSTTGGICEVNTTTGDIELSIKK